MREFYLMDKDTKICTLNYSDTDDGLEVSIAEMFSELPVGFREENIKKWLFRRMPSLTSGKNKVGNHLSVYADDFSEYVDLTNCVSLTDDFWIKSTDSELTWREVQNCDRAKLDVINEFCINGVPIEEKGLLTQSPSLSLDGNFMKCWCEENGVNYLYKRGSCLYGKDKIEPYMEVLACQVSDILCNSVHYELSTKYDKVCSKVECFVGENEYFVPIGLLTYDDAEWYDDNGMGEDFRRMSLCDYVLMNGDRHLFNSGILVGKEIRMSPVYDFNLALLPFCDLEDLKSLSTDSFNDYNKYFDLMTDDILTDFKNLHGFKFIKLGVEFIDSRLEELSRLCNERIAKMITMCS